MSKKTHNLFLGILIPMYSLIFILFIFFYLHKEENFNKINSDKNEFKNNTADEIHNLSNYSNKLNEIQINQNAISTSTKDNNTNNVANYTSIKTFEYIKIINSCDTNYKGGCVNARSGPGSNYSVVDTLRNGMVLKVSSKALGEDGKIWYHVIFDEWLRYPEKVKDDWFVSANFTKHYFANVEQIKNYKNFINTYSGEKKILIKLKEQKLYAYENINGENRLFLETFISTGLNKTPTPIGNFKIFHKTPSRYMQGPIPRVTEKHFDLPGVPWVMYFTGDGAAIHGTYWHENFGNNWSNGCVNLYEYDAKTLYDWANLGTEVIIEN